MPVRVVLVHDDQSFLSEAETALANAGYEVTILDNPSAALGVLASQASVDLLITRVQFGAGKQHGISLARMARTKHVGIQILFVARAEFEEHASLVGEFVAMPVSISELLSKVVDMVRLDRHGEPA